MGGKRGMSFGGSFQGFFFTGPRKLSNSVLEKGCFNGFNAKEHHFQHGVCLSFTIRTQGKGTINIPSTTLDIVKDPSAKLAPLQSYENDSWQSEFS